jgi:hypothetical protein
VAPAPRPSVRGIPQLGGESSACLGFDAAGSIDRSLALVGRAERMRCGAGAGIFDSREAAGLGGRGPCLYRMVWDGKSETQLESFPVPCSVIVGASTGRGRHEQSRRY